MLSTIKKFIKLQNIMKEQLKFKVAAVQYEPSQFNKRLNIDSLLNLSEQAAKEGRIYSNAYYPVHELAKLSWKIRPEILLAIARRESEFNLRAKSGAGARGFMQIMPGTAKKYRLI